MQTRNTAHNTCFYVNYAGDRLQAYDWQYLHEMAADHKTTTNYLTHRVFENVARNVFVY